MKEIVGLLYMIFLIFKKFDLNMTEKSKSVFETGKPVILWKNYLRMRNHIYKFMSRWFIYLTVMSSGPVWHNNIRFRENYFINMHFDKIFINEDWVCKHTWEGHKNNFKIYRARSISYNTKTISQKIRFNIIDIGAYYKLVDNSVYIIEESVSWIHILN